MTDAHFAWMLGQGPAPDGFRLAPGGIDAPEILGLLRRMTQRLHAGGSRASWLIVSGGEVVGLCSYKQPPKDGIVEIGYGVAASRRGLGHASRAVTAMLDHAARDPVRRVVATIAADNRASTRAVEANGFVQNGTVLDPDDGELLLWQKDLA